MTNQQIFEKAIEKAKKNGWKTKWTSIVPEYVNIIIFSHDFAKAFWGEKPFKHLGARAAYSLVIGVRINYDRGVPAWIYHLQKMVIYPDPIKYLEKFL